MATYIVTGGYGFLGRNLVRLLREGGHDAIVASRTSHHDFSDDNWIEYDLKDHSTIHNIINARSDGVFHLAWSSSPATAEADPAYDISTNLAGTICLLDHLAKSRPIPVVLTSSGGTVYGSATPEPIVETHPRHPISIYGMTKCAMELYAQQCQLLNHMDIRIARVSNPYGAGQAVAKMQGAATIFTRKIIRGEKIEIWGRGNTVRDYVDVEDVASGLASIMNLPKSDAPGEHVFNVGSGQGISLVGLIERIEKLTGKKAEVVFSESRGFDIPINILNVDKLRAASGWEPRNIDDRLAALVKTLVREIKANT